MPRVRSLSALLAAQSLSEAHYGFHCRRKVTSTLFVAVLTHNMGYVHVFHCIPCSILRITFQFCETNRHFAELAEVVGRSLSTTGTVEDVTNLTLQTEKTLSIGDDVTVSGDITALF